MCTSREVNLRIRKTNKNKHARAQKLPETKAAKTVAV
jgi:hypothetical protein